MTKQFSAENLHLMGSHSASASSMTMLSNRVSHVFDFRGPSVSMDTACSSSLMATHFACQSLWNGDCSMAVVGGVSVMFRPSFPIAMCKGGFLSPLARCMAFDERAAGYARGEGAGAVILKPLADAVRDGDRIYAAIRGTGANQDGRTPGISLPNRAAQVALIRRVLARAGVGPSEVAYVEAHGTGTQAGDVAELGALQEVFGSSRSPDDPLVVGTIKTNLGHTEAAAGVAGLMKAALSLHHGMVPPNLHFERPNPKIPFDDLCLKVATEPVPLRGETPRVASVNSFGYGGANAHVVLTQVRAPAAAEAPAVAEAPRSARASEASGSSARRRDGHAGLFVVPLSARDEVALRQRAGQVAQVLAEPAGPALADVVHTLVHRRSHLSQRLVVTAEDRAGLSQQLAAFAQGRAVPGSATGAQPSTRPQTAFVYTGMGPQWWAMGRELMACEPVYAAAIREIDERFGSIAGWSIAEALAADEDRSQITRTRVAQPTNFALQVALTRLWASWGITPDAVVGHSVGEVASTWASGALSLDDAVQVSFHRSRLQQALAGGEAELSIERGAMLAAGIPEPQAQQIAAQRPGVSIAAINSATSVTFSGDRAAIAELAATLEAQGCFCRPLDVEVAYHSHHMEPLRAPLAAALAGLSPRDTTIPLYSTVTGGPVPGSSIDGAYWSDNMRQAVLFRAAIRRLLEDGVRVFVEVGPHPVLRSALAEITAELGHDGVVVPSLRRREPERARMLQTLGALYVAGHEPAWDEVAPTDGRLVDLPAYPWQRTVQWAESEASRRAVVGDPQAHVLLQTRREGPCPTWVSELTPMFLPWLPDHRIAGSVIMPGAGYIEAALAMACAAQSDPAVDAGPPWPLTLTDVDFHRLLGMDRRQVTDLQLRCDLHTRQWSIAAGDRAAPRWVEHARGGLVRRMPGDGRPRRFDLPALRDPLASASIDVERVYGQLHAAGLEYGPTFRTLVALWAQGGRALARLQLATPSDAEGYLLHPAVLDGAFQAAVGVLVEGSTPGAVAPMVPVGVDRLELYGPLGAQAWAVLELRQQTAHEVVADLWLLDDEGVGQAVLQGLTLRPLPAEGGEDTTPDDHAFRWVEQPLEARTGDEHSEAERTDAPSGVLLVGRDHALEQAGRGLVARGVTLVRARLGASSAPVAADLFSVAPDELETLADVVIDRGLEQIVVVVPPESEQPVADLEALGWGLLALVRAVVARRARPVVTVATTIRGPGQPDLVGGALTAMLRVVHAEYDAVSTRSIELVDTAAGWDRLAEELLDLRAEPEVRLRADGRDVRRLEAIPVTPAEPVEAPRIRSVRTDDAAVALEIGQVGSLGSLHHVLTERRAPGPNEVEIRVVAAGINFKDLLKYAGQLEPRVVRDTFYGAQCGMECVGVVERVGAEVEGLSVGDRVGGIPGQGGFRSFTTTGCTTVRRLPPEVSSPVAASLFIPAMTAWHGLHNVARVQPGEVVLIHSAAGGVGFCAVQIAQAMGATVIATVGTEDKRRFLREHGVAHIAHSRDLSFVDDVRRWTDGRGVDVVLSAMAGDAFIESIRLLARHGRFVDIGKKTLVDNEVLPLRMFNEGLSYTAIDMDRLLRDRPTFCMDMAEQGLLEVAAGRMEAPPVRVFEAGQAAEAFLVMAQGQHMGRLAIRYDRTTVEVTEVPAAAGSSGERAGSEPGSGVGALVRADGTYVVTGGLGGFGLEVARWLARRGAGGLLLLGRRGLDTPGAAEAVEALAAEGTRVQAMAVDVSDRSALAGALSAARASRPPLPPIRGVFHCAMVLDDGYIDALSRERLARVLAPKAQGAWWLDQLTADDPLDHFVGFSSVAVAVGNPGQASYVAANGFLDALAEVRRAKGRPGLSIQWGVLGEVGVVTRHREVGEQLASGGMVPMSTHDALDGLERALRSEAAHLGIYTVDWERWTAQQPDLARRPLYARVRSGAWGRGSPLFGLIVSLLEVEPGQWSHQIAHRLRAEVARLLGMDPEQIGLARSLGELGVDSLLAVELVNELTPQGYPIKVVDLMRGPTLEELAAGVLAAVHEALRSHGEDLRDSGEDLSPEQAERLAALTGPPDPAEPLDPLDPLDPRPERA